MPEQLRQQQLSGLYGLVDAALSDPIPWGRALAESGCPVIQLRAKMWTPERIRFAAQALRTVTHEEGCLLIINDHPDIAVEVGADGVHLGQDDLSVVAARRLVGPRMLIGLSTHTIAQVKAAGLADYIGFGPIFQTQTKAQAGSAVGPTRLQQAVENAPCPVVAIGGISPHNLASVRATGTRAWAVASALTQFGTAREAVAAMHPDC
jgi:thiamine-phosphate pyrophosphorylase